MPVRSYFPKKVNSARLDVAEPGPRVRMPDVAEDRVARV